MPKQQDFREEIDVSFEELAQSINIVFVSISTFLVFGMQFGFGFLEGGAVRIRNIQATQFKNCIDVCIATVIWYLIGYGLAFGADVGSFLGGSHFAGTNFDGVMEYENWYFSWSFAGTAATIVSGCILERMKMSTYFLFSAFQSGWIYPIVVHWTWGGGWLHKLGYIDHAGGSVVHMVGGMAGLMCTMKIGKIFANLQKLCQGPRYERFNMDTEIQNSFRPNNIAYMVLGALFLWFSFYGFNVGSARSTVGGVKLHEVLLTMMSTTLSACSGAVTCVLIFYFQNRNSDVRYKSNKFEYQNVRYSIPIICNGFLSGLVAITPSCAFVTPCYGFTIGVIAGISYLCFSKIMYWIKIDDPLDAVALHLGTGFIGILCEGLLDNQRGAIFTGNARFLGIQCLGAVTIAGWVSINALFFVIMADKFGILRFESQVQIEGIDKHYFGGPPWHFESFLIQLMERQKRLRKAKQKREEMLRNDSRILDIRETPGSDIRQQSMVE